MFVKSACGQMNRGNGFSRSRLIIWSRDTGLAVSSRVSLLILRTQSESVNVLLIVISYSQNSSYLPRRCPFIYTANLYRVSPECIGSRNRVSMTFIAESSPAQGQESSS